MIGIEQIRHEVARVREHIDPHPDVFASLVAHELGMESIDWACPVDRQVMAMIRAEIAASEVA